jgi:PKD repeat protein
MNARPTGSSGRSQCNAAFSSTPLSAHTRQFNHVAGSAEDSTTTYRWAFGDGDTANIANPLHTFADTGTFTVCLNVYVASTQCVSDTCIQIHIDTCQAYFTYIYNPTLSQPEEDIYFFTDSSFGESPSATYLWSFGTGDFSSVRNPAFVYEAGDSGFEQVCLTIRNPDGCTSQFCRTIWVDDLCLKATFSYTMQGSTGTFKASVCGPWSTLNWNFGDGVLASQSDSVVHTFAAVTDSYFVCVEVNIDTVCLLLYPCRVIYCRQVYVDLTGIENVAAPQQGITVFPNPSSGSISISYSAPLPNPAQIELSDITGKQVKRIMANPHPPNNTTAINIADLPPGIYFVRLTSEEGQWVRKVVVER